MKWPRGKYNPGRIVGFECKVRVGITTWRLSWPRYGSALVIGPVAIWLTPAYDATRPAPAQKET